MGKKIAYLGPPGTFTEEAALLYDKGARFIPVPTIPGVASAVSSGMSDEGVVPIENSLEGSVTDTLDLLIHDSILLIRKELVLPVGHQLLVKPGTGISDVKVLYSHPQSLGQCRRFVERILPKAEVVAALSNAAAVQDMMESSTPAAAIGTKRAAELYGAEILAKEIQDQASNVTRFVVLAAEDHASTGADKTSICFSFDDDRPGALVEVLQEFSQRNINLAKVESRPSKEVLGKYFFLIDLEGHREDSPVSEALEGVRGKTSLFKIFGSYPRHK
jgi:prephenate dehydratase